MARKNEAKRQIFICPVCGVGYRKKLECRKHVLQCVPGPAYTCAECRQEVPKKDWYKHQMYHKVLAQLAHEDSRCSARSSRNAACSQPKIGGRVILKFAKNPNRTNHKKWCTLTIDPDCQLFHLRCTLGCPDHHFNLSHATERCSGKAEYLWCRRRLRKMLGLLTASAPLDACSYTTFNCMARSCGIISNTNFAHLSLVEGYKQSEKGANYRTWIEYTSRNLLALREAVTENPFIAIESLHTVPKLGDTQALLIVANVFHAFDFGAGAELVSNCALPQFPFHLAVGACPVGSAAEALEAALTTMVGLKLKLDARFLAILAPSLDIKYVPNLTAEQYASRRESNLNAFDTAISSAAHAAQELNQMLYNSCES